MLAAGRTAPLERRVTVERVLVAVALLLGIAAVAFAETFVAEAMLAAFMASIVVVLAVHLIQRAGVTH